MKEKHLWYLKNKITITRCFCTSTEHTNVLVINPLVRLAALYRANHHKIPAVHSSFVTYVCLKKKKGKKLTFHQWPNYLSKVSLFLSLSLFVYRAGWNNPRGYSKGSLRKKSFSLNEFKVARATSRLLPVNYWPLLVLALVSSCRLWLFAGRQSFRTRR